MSRILFSTMFGGTAIPVAIGWDRRLSQCFVSINVAVLDDEACEEDERLAALLQASAAGMSPNLGVEDCKTILTRARIVAPPGVFDVLEDHVRRNAGNLVVKVDDSGKVDIVLDDSPTT